MKPPLIRSNSTPHTSSPSGSTSHHVKRSSNFGLPVHFPLVHSSHHHYHAHHYPLQTTTTTASSEPDYFASPSESRRGSVLERERGHNDEFNSTPSSFGTATASIGTTTTSSMIPVGQSSTPTNSRKGSVVQMIDDSLGKRTVFDLRRGEVAAVSGDLERISWNRIALEFVPHAPLCPYSQG